MPTLTFTVAPRLNPVEVAVRYERMDHSAAYPKAPVAITATLSDGTVQTVMATVRLGYKDADGNFRTTRYLFGEGGYGPRRYEVDADPGADALPIYPAVAKTVAEAVEEYARRVAIRLRYDQLKTGA